MKIENIKNNEVLNLNMKSYRSNDKLKRSKLVNTGIIFIFGVILILSLQLVYAEIIWSNPIDSNFIGDIGAKICRQTDTTSYWDYWTGGVHYTPSSLESCHDSEGWGSDVCCPLVDKPICQWNDAEGDYDMCIEGIITGCGDYDNSEECVNHFSPGVADSDMENIIGITGFCSGSYGEIVSIGVEECERRVSDCKCWWDEAESDPEVKKCKPGYNSNISCPEEGYGGECLWSQGNIEGDCSVEGTSEIVVDLTAIWNWFTAPEINPENYIDSNCTSQNDKHIPCPDIIELDFFNVTSLVLALILLIILYYLVIKQRKKYAGKKSSPKRKSRKKKRR